MNLGLVDSLEGIQSKGLRNLEKTIHGTIVILLMIKKIIYLKGWVGVSRLLEKLEIKKKKKKNKFKVDKKKKKKKK